MRFSATCLALLWIAGGKAVLVADQPEEVRVTERDLWDAVNLTQPQLAAVRAAVTASDLSAAASAWAAYFAARERPMCHFDRESWPILMRAEFPAVADAMVVAAERVVSGHIEHGPARLPVRGRAPAGVIDWLHNPARDTNYVSLVGSQWFMNPLGRAYLLSGDRRFAQTFAWVFESWFDHQEAICRTQGGLGFNPIYRAYYPGVQARILVDNYYCLKDSPVLAPSLHVKVLRQLLACARFLARQENRYRPGNQQVAAAVGLGMVGLVFPEFREAAAWVAQAERIMVEHLARDFFPDGGHRELCTQYHKTCLRDMTYMALTSEQNGRPSPLLQGESGQRFLRAVDWLAKLVLPTGETPPFHSAVFSTDHAVYTLLSGVLWRRRGHAWLAERFWRRNECPTQKAPLAYAAYLLSSQIRRADLPAAKAPGHCSVHLPDSGIAVMRTGWEEEACYLALQYGWANSGHAYPAALSFLLAMNGEIIATHPGSPRSYSHPDYRYCRTTAAHQTITIDSASYPKVKGLAPGGGLDALSDLPGLWYVRAHHRGYEPQFGIVHHRRIVVVKEGPVLVLDRLVGGRGHTAQWRFHTPLRVDACENGVVALAGRRRYALVAAHPEEIDQVTTRKHWAAVLPRDCQPDDCGSQVNELSLEKRIGAAGAHFIIAVFEGRGRVSAEGDCVVRLSQRDREYVVLSGPGRVKTRRVEADAELAAVEFRRGRAARCWVVEGTSLRVDGVACIDTESPTSGTFPLDSAR